MIKEKVIITNNLRYGCDYPMQNEEIFKKACQTNVEKYGYERPSQNEEIKKIIKKTNFDKYGVESLFQNKEFREMIDNIIMDKYGVKNYTQTDEYKEKTIETCLEKYNTKHYSQSNEFKEKFKQTCLDKYGCDNPMRNKLIQEKARQTLYKNGTCPTSTHQLYIYNLLKENNYNVELNFPLSNVNLDVAIFIGETKIDLEYDALFWHQDKNKDRRRDEFLKSEDWKILRIRSGKLLPTLEQIEESINKLVISDRTFTQIVLDDWKN